TEEEAFAGLCFACVRCVLPEAAMNRDSRTRRAWWRLLAGLLFALPVHTPAAAEDAPSISIMLKEGWQIAGYSQASDNRSTFILFRHPDQAYLVQCRAGLRRDAHAPHLLDLLQAQVSGQGGCDGCITPGFPKS